MSFDESRISIETLPEKHIVYVERRADAHGSFNDAAPAAIHALMEYAQTTGAPVRLETFMGIVPDDMTAADLANNRYWAAVEYNGAAADLPPSSDIHTATLAPGREMLYEMIGSYDQLPEAWGAFAAYQKAKGYPFRGPMYEAYIDNPATTPEATMRTILHIPLQD